MSRKSKRRRSRHGDNPSPAAGTADFEFLDDRDTPREDGYVRPPRAGEPSAAAPVAAPVAAAAATAVAVAPETKKRPVVAPSSPKPAAASSQNAAPQAAAPAVAVAVAAPEPPAEPVATLGEILTAARQARGLSIEEASARTRIAAKMLQHLENDRFSEFAAEAYVRGFLRSYSNLLRLDVAMVLVRYEALVGRPASPVTEDWTPDVETAPAPVRARRKNRGNAIGGVVIGVVAALTAVGVVLSERGIFELRPSAGLQQIEDELRAAQPSTENATPRDAGAEADVHAKADGTTPPLITAESGTATAPPTPDGGAAAAPPTADGGAAAAPPSPVRDLPGPEDAAPTPPVSAPTQNLAATSMSDAVVLDDNMMLVLTATARDTCTLRLQIDADARHAQRYAFTQIGETRSWSAKQSFRLLARNGAQLELRLNGKPMSVPADGRTVVFDRATLRGETPAAPPKKTRRSSRRKSRPAAETAKPASAPAPAVPDPTPQNAAGPP